MSATKFTKQMTVPEFEKLFPSDDACKEYLIARRWPEGARCPRCGNENVAEISSRPFTWQCRKCSPNGYRFSVLVGTIFENTNVSLKTWFHVIYLLSTSKKGISSLQIHRMMGFGSYSTAHYMCHRVRAGLVDPEFRKLMGMVEVDETFIGRKWYNKHKYKRGGGTGGHGSGKSGIIGAVERKGSVVAREIDNTDTKTLDGFVREVLSDKVSLLSTDEQSGYRKLKKYFPDKAVAHGRGQYFNGAVHTKTIEGFWSLVKRGVMGSYHKASRKYLPLYVAEFQFRYNNRHNPDIFGAVVARW